MGFIYFVLFERDDDVEVYVMMLGGGGVWGVMLGYGMIGFLIVGDDVRVYGFFGDYDMVGRVLLGL